MSTNPNDTKLVNIYDDDGTGTGAKKWWTLSVAKSLPDSMLYVVVDASLKAKKAQAKQQDVLAAQAAKFPTAAEQGGAPGSITPPNYGGPLDLLKGAVKGAGQTGLALPSKIAAAGSRIALPGVGVTATIPTPEQLKEGAAPSNLLQSVGKFAEQAGEYAVPGGAVSKITKGEKILKYSIQPASAITKSLAQGLTGLGVATAQGKEPAEALATGAISAAVPAVTEMAWPGIKDWITKNVTSRMLNRLMEVTPAMTSHGADPGGQIIKEGIIANSKEAMLKQVEKKIPEAGQDLAAALTVKGAGKVVDAETIVQTAIQTASKKIGRGSDPAFRQSLVRVADDMFDALPMGKKLSNLTPLEAQDLKATLGKSIDWSGKAEQADLNKVLKDIYTGLNEATEAAVPGAKELLRRHGNLTVAKISLQNAMNKDRGRSIIDGGGILKNLLKPLSGAGPKTRAGQAFNPGKSRLGPVFNPDNSRLTPGARLVQSTLGASDALGGDDEDR